jgi:hypothetical protein
MRRLSALLSILLPALSCAANGKRIPGYGAQAAETARVEATEGWLRIAARFPLTAPEITSIVARLAVCGVGEATFDDVTMCRLLPPEVRGQVTEPNSPAARPDETRRR